MKLTLKQRLFFTYTAIGIVVLIGLGVRLYIFEDWSTELHIYATLFSFLIVSIVCEAHILLNKILNSLFPFEKSITKRIVIQLIVSAAFMKGLHFLVFPHVSKAIGIGDNPYFYALTTLVIIAISVAINAILIASFFFGQWRESLTKNLILEKEKAIVQFDGLKNQLNPHFLFNTLTSLDSLIHEDPDLASRFLQHLSKVYRYLLENDLNATVSLNKEKEFISNYVFLLKTRFSDRIEIFVDIPESNLDMNIVPVTLQNLIENAVKHNIIDDINKLVIRIYCADGFILVENNVNLKSRVESSNGKGLQNLKNLYKLLSNKEIFSEVKNNKFIAKIPLLN